MKISLDVETEEDQHLKATAVSLSEAAQTYLVSLPADGRQEKQQEINRFVLWYGRERPIDTLTVTEVARYAEQFALSHTDPKRRLAPVREFLTYAKKKGLIEISLANHLGVVKATSRPKKGVVHAPPRKEVLLTATAQAQVKADLDALKAQRPLAADEIRKAAADKDFRENAPLEAAREHHEQLESRIKDLETMLNNCVVQQALEHSAVARLSCTVVLRDTSSGDKVTYTLVSPNEVAAANGKISIYSPMGKAVVGHREGEVVDVVAPSGKMQFCIESVKR